MNLQPEQRTRRWLTAQQIQQKMQEKNALDASKITCPRKRARRVTGFALRAEFEARRYVAEHQKLPTTAELRSLVGGGSQRDIAKARSDARVGLVDAPSEASMQEIRALKEEVAKHKSLAENATAAADERVRGLERHLLLETARIRDELEQRARIKSPFGTIVATIEREYDEREEKIYE